MAEEDKKNDAPAAESDGDTPEGEEGTEGAEGENAPKSKKKLFIIIGGAVALLAIIGIVLFLFVLKPTPDEKTMDEGTEGLDINSLDGAQLENAPPVYKDLEPLSVNLLTERGNRFLKIKLTLEYAGPVDDVTYAEAVPRIEDDLNTYLRQLRPDDLKGTANIYKLKEDLLIRLGQSSHPLNLKNVLFRELIVQ